jgi:hypothetical protein
LAVLSTPFWHQWIQLESTQENHFAVEVKTMPHHFLSWIILAVATWFVLNIIMETVKKEKLAVWFVS